MSQDKISRERQILSLALPLLKEIYGEFDIDNNQVDNPDAAIVLNDNSKMIGIEITSVDSPKVKAYFNDEKECASERLEQLECLLEGGSFTAQPMKKMSVKSEHNYIFNGLIKKSEKYESYVSSRSYHEMIVVASSEYLEISNEYFFEYHMPWTNYLLSDSLFPFDKVVYVCENSEKAALVYDKEKPLEVPPKLDKMKEAGMTRSLSPIIPVGVDFNYNEIFEKEPFFLPKSNSKKEKKKNKAQRLARRINRKKKK